MFPNISPVQTASWKKLLQHQQYMKGIQMKNLFRNDPHRFDHFSLDLNDILFDYSKNLINAETFSMLMELARESGLADAIQAMFSGEKINRTEDRSVLHTALRNLSGSPVYSDGKDVMPDVLDVLAHMKSFSEKIHSGEWRGYS